MALSKFENSPQLSSTQVTIVLALYFIVALNFVLLKKLFAIFSDMSNFSIPFLLTIPCFFLAAFIFLFTPFVSKYIAKPVFIALLLLSAFVNYATYTFGIVINKDMMTNFFDTTSAEAFSYFNLKLLIWIFLNGVLPAALLAWIDIKYERFPREFLRKLVVMMSALAVIGAIAAVYYKDYASIARNNPKIQKDIVPTYFLSSVTKYINAKYFTVPLSYTHVGADAKRIPPEKKEKYLVVFMVGETARAQNYELNGYPRATNKHTRNIKNLISFKSVSSCGTATAISLPCMFSMMGHSNYTWEKFISQDNVIDILKRGGTKAVWIDNNTGCKGVCKGIQSYSTTDMPELDCVGEECTDNVFLDVIDKKVQTFKGDDGIVFLHLLGSHGPTYYKRYPKEHATFQPDCQTSDLSKCTDEQIINSYDNTILFTDYLMSKIITKLKKYDDSYYTAVVYVSDHGESLGESGIYLHGMPYDIAPKNQTHVPFIMWFSDKMIKHKKLDVACLKKRADTMDFSHDNLSPTLINLMDIDTVSYDKNKDIIASCEDIK